MSRLKITQDQLDNPCKGCKSHGKPAECCQYIRFVTPTTHDGLVDFDSLHWYMTRASRGIFVRAFMSSGTPSQNPADWEVFLSDECPHLNKTGQCTNYDKRPGTCAEYSPFPTKAQPWACTRYGELPEHVDLLTESQFLRFTDRHFRYKPSRADLPYLKNRITVTPSR